MQSSPSETLPAQPTGTAAVDVRDVSLTYPNGIRALDGVSLSVSTGEFVALIGPNGSGKSSLLRAIAGLQNVQRGAVTLAGLPVARLSSVQRARHVALVPQSLDLPPGHRVADFVLLGRFAHLTGWRLFTHSDRQIVRACLERVEALSFWDREMDELSGGERQRVLIARALAQESHTILLDEPTSALDLKHQLSVYKLIRALPRVSDRTVVVVTHDLNLASQFADRLVLLKDGRVAGEGSPEEVLRPALLANVYEAELAYGWFEDTPDGRKRPWVLPRAKRL